jgi:hypothetical protein
MFVNPECFETKLVEPVFCADYLSWDAKEFAEATHITSKKFPPLEVGRRIHEPAIIVDCKGRIVLWYLPGLLLPPRQVSSLYYDYQ